MPVSISSEVLPEIFEHERFSTTVVNAALSPVVGRLHAHGSANGCGPDGYAARPAAAAQRRRRHDPGQRQAISPRGSPGPASPRARSPAATSPMLCGFPEFDRPRHGRHLDDVSLAYEGQSRVTKDWDIEFGYPIRFPIIEVLDHRRRRRIARLDRRGGLAAQRPAIGRRPSRARPATATATRSRPTPTPTSCLAASAPSLAGGKHHARPGTGRRGGAQRRRGAVRPVGARRRPTRSSGSPTPTWPTRCG